MGILDEYKIVTITRTSSAKTRTWEEIVDDTIAEQIRIADGEVIRGTKRNPKTGEYNVKQSWFKNGKCKPKFWIKPLLDTNQKFEMSESEYKTFLTKLQNWRNDQTVKPLIDRIEQQYIAQMARLRKQRD